MKTNDPRKRALIESLKNGLIVSCQVQDDDPISTPDMRQDGGELRRGVHPCELRPDSRHQGCRRLP